MKNLILFLCCIGFMGCPSETPPPSPPPTPPPSPQATPQTANVLAGKWKAGPFELHFEESSDRFHGYCGSMEIQGTYELVTDKLKLKLDSQDLAEAFFKTCGSKFDWWNGQNDQDDHRWLIPVQLPIQDYLILLGIRQTTVAHMNKI